MIQYQRLLVCIQRSDRDYRMLDYTGAICRTAETKEVHLLHVQSGESAPSSDAALEAAEHLKGHGSEQVICQVVTGSPLVEILRYFAPSR